MTTNPYTPPRANVDENDDYGASPEVVPHMWALREDLEPTERFLRGLGTTGVAFATVFLMAGFVAAPIVWFLAVRDGAELLAAPVVVACVVAPVLAVRAAQGLVRLEPWSRPVAYVVTFLLLLSFPAGLPFGRRAWKVLASYEAEVIYSDLFVRVRRETPEHDVTPDRSHARRFLFAAFLEVVVVCSGLILML